MKKYEVEITKKDEINLIEVLVDSGFFAKKYYPENYKGSIFSILDLEDVAIDYVCNLSEEIMPDRLFREPIAKVPSIIEASFGAWFERESDLSKGLVFGFDTMIPIFYLARIMIALEDNTTSLDAEDWALKHIVDSDDCVISYQHKGAIDIEEADRMRIGYVLRNAK